MTAILAAKHRSVLQAQATTENNVDHKAQYNVKSRLVMYTSDQSNSSVEKSAHIADSQVRLLKSDGMGVLRGDVFLEAVQADIAQGNIPCCVSIENRLYPSSLCYRHRQFKIQARD